MLDDLQLEKEFCDKCIDIERLCNTIIATADPSNCSNISDAWENAANSIVKAEINDFIQDNQSRMSAGDICEAKIRGSEIIVRAAKTAKNRILQFPNNEDHDEALGTINLFIELP